MQQSFMDTKVHRPSSSPHGSVSTLETHQPCATQLDSVITHSRISWFGESHQVGIECALPFKSKPRVFTKGTGPGERKIVFILYKEKGRLEGLEA